MNLLIATVAGILIVVFTGLANTSVRRLAVVGSVGLLIAFFAMSFSEVTGALSRHTTHPTLMGFVPLYPPLLLILVASIAGLLATFAGGRAGGLTLIAASLATVVIALLWRSQPAAIVGQLSLNGLMEALTGLALGGLLTASGWGQPRLRWPLLAVGAAVAVGSFLLLNSSLGHRYFPNAEGYYRLFTPTSESTARSIMDTYNDSLEDLNRRRRSAGLSLLEPLESLDDLDKQRLPRTAAADIIDEHGKVISRGFRIIQPANGGYGTPLVFFFTGLMFGGGLMLAWRPQLRSASDLVSGGVIAAIVSILTPAFAATDFSFQRLAEGWPFLLDFLDRSWPPNGNALKEVASEMLITIEIALIGTFLAAIFAIPLSFLAARNLTQNNSFMRAVFGFTRGFFNIDRGIDTLILALVFVAAVGLGPFAGVLAMAIHSIADLGKLYSESIENVDRGPIEALESVGASGTNVVRWAILPQVAPLFVAWTLYRFEINFRVSIVLGLVGAGGIGFFIQENMGTGSYDDMVVAIIAIVIVVNTIDFASSYLRARLV